MNGNKKRSFFERLSGSVPAGDYDSFDEDLRLDTPRARQEEAATPPERPRGKLLKEDSGAEGQLPVDVYQTADEIIIRAFVAGVRADELNVAISRDMVVLEGSRAEREEVTGSDYFTRELFWGSFARTILLPQEVDVDNSSATAKDGLLTIVLPRLDKAKQTKIRVRAG